MCLNFGSFQRSLQLKKKAFDRTITELEQKAAEEAVANEVIEKLGDLVRERKGIEKKLSTTYSLGRDRAGLQSKPLLPLYDGKTRSYSFQSAKKESVTIFHTLSDTSSRESSSEREINWNSEEDEKVAAKGKARAPIEAESSSDDGILVKDYRRSPSEPASSSREYVNPLFLGQETREEKLHDGGESVQSMPQSSGRSIWLKRRRTLSSTN